MLLLSKTKDYYDHLVSQGVDKSVVYKRSQGELELSKDSLSLDINLRVGLRNREFTSLRYYVYFCGKFYPGVLFSFDDKDCQKVIRYCYTFDDYKSAIAEFNDALKRSVTLKKKEDRSLWSDESLFYHFMFEFFKKTVDASVENIHKISTPIGYVGVRGNERRSFLDDKLNVLTDINLKEIEFYRVKDTYTAFTEISQFISGVLGGNSPALVEVEDKYKISAHGFDKQSFRTRKKVK